MKNIHPKFVIITRPQSESEILEHQIIRLGLNIFSYPSIIIRANELNESQKEALQQLHTFDWILFTSRNGVSFFMKALHDLNVDTAIMKQKNIGAVGPKTADEIKKYHLQIQFISEQFTTEALGREIQDIANKKILLPRSDLANPELTKQLQTKGAKVIDIPIYQTIPFPKRDAIKNKELDKRMNNHEILCLTFTSPSTITGFMQNLNDDLKNRILTLPVFSIGPVTAAAAKKKGFTNIQIADIFTIEGLLSKLQKSLV